MFEIGSFVVYGNTGICKIEEITTLDMPGMDNGKMYYVMTAIYGNCSKCFVPVDNTKVILREVINKDRAEEIIDNINNIPNISIDNDKLREEKYKELMKQCDCQSFITIIQTVIARKKERLDQGKKLTATDERYYRMAMQYLCSELAFVLGVSPIEIEERINSKLQL